MTRAKREAKRSAVRAAVRASELAQLERLLDSDGAPMRLAEIAHRMAVSPRTALRRIGELQDAGIAVAIGRRDGGSPGWVLARLIAREWDVPGGARQCRKTKDEGDLPCA